MGLGPSAIPHVGRVERLVEALKLSDIVNGDAAAGGHLSAGAGRADQLHHTAIAEQVRHPVTEDGERLSRV